MTKNSQYRKGEPITSLDELCEQPVVWLEYSHRAINQAFILNQQARILKHFIDHGMIFTAVKKEN